jgi:CubicO group peptidase (beta-lactamase class C family)
MKRQMLILLAFGLALFSCAKKDAATKIKDIDAFLIRNKDLNKFSGTILVALDGKILLNKGYGYSNFENRIANDTGSVFQIYSITKTFTSTMIFKLIEQGKLSLDDRLSKFYPSFPNGENITIEHLLTHTSGINDHSNEQNAPSTEAYRVALFGKNKPNFAPGEGWSYCNGGYQLLGYIIAKITAMPYERAIRENIFNPLGMSKSGFDFKDLSSPEKVTAYHIFTNDKKETAVLYDSTGPFSAGSMYSTVGDLYKYYRSFKSHQILNEASQQIAFSPSKTNKGYGHGWQLNSNIFKNTVISHSGGAVGFRSSFAMIPGDDICVIILNNHENAHPEFLTRRIIDILNDKSFEPVREAELTTATLEKLVGAFSIKEPRMMLYTSVLDGRLAIEIAGQPKAVLVAKNENTFVQEEADAILEFSKDEKDVYSEISIHQGSRKMIANRIESSWGLIGDATPKGWGDTAPDIRFVADKERKGLWVLKNITLKKGEMKFRLDNDWNVNYGDNAGDKILDIHGENIRIEAGVYDIVLDLTEEGRPRYSVSKGVLK